MTSFETKDSGKRSVFGSGMVRDTNHGKPRYDLMIPLDTVTCRPRVEVEFLALLGLPYVGTSRAELSAFLCWWTGEQSAWKLFECMQHHSGPLLQRYAELMARGAEKYEARNWEQANGEEELARFRESAFRHFVQYLRREDDEDHAAAVVFNVRAHDWLSAKLGERGFAASMEETREVTESSPRLYWRYPDGINLLRCCCLNFPECYYDPTIPCNLNSDGTLAHRPGTPNPW